MPPPLETAAVRVELGPLRELLDVDRRGVGEVRTARSSVQLTTATYAMPLRVRWRRAFRRSRRLRVAVRSACLCAVVAAAFWSAPLWDGLPTRALSWAKSASASATATVQAQRWDGVPARALSWAKTASASATTTLEAQWMRVSAWTEREMGRMSGP